MIVKKKNKRDPQRLQHSVRFDIEFFTKHKEDDPSKLIIDFVQIIKVKILLNSP